MSEILKRAKLTLSIEANAVKDQIKHLDREFIKAVELISSCSGRVVVMGIGKSGIIGRKIAATMSSLGIPSVFLHPSECLHGDIGMLMNDDVVLMLSYTGESEEIKKVLPLIKNTNVKTICLTGKPNAKTWTKVDCKVNSAIKKEACPYNLAPTASTSAMMALGDALALCASEKKGFKREKLVQFHAGGSIGKKVTLKVSDIVRKETLKSLISENATVGEALVIMTYTRAGAVCVIDSRGKLAGYFTDGDLRRHLLKDKMILHRRIGQIMTQKPLTIGPEFLAVDAADILRKHNFDNIPVVNGSGYPAGILDERDLLTEGIV